MNRSPHISSGVKAGAFITLSVFLPILLFAYVSPGKPSGYVNDFAHIFKAETITSLNTELTNFRNKTTSEISVVTVPSLGDETIESYAPKLFKEWGIGQAKQDNGVLLLVAPNERVVRIEVGYGLEPVITDIESSHIISDVITPAFKAGDYDKGVIEGTKRLELDAINEYPVSTTENTSQNHTQSSTVFSLLSHLFYPIIFGLIMLSSFLARSKSWWAGGVIGAGLGVLVLVFVGVVVGIAAIIGLTILGLLFDYIVSKRGGSGKGPFPPFFFGGGGLGGGRGFGGGGGFGGFGGGMSGGGGSSGRW